MLRRARTPLRSRLQRNRRTIAATAATAALVATGAVTPALTTPSHDDTPSRVEAIQRLPRIGQEGQKRSERSEHSEHSQRAKRTQQSRHAQRVRTGSQPAQATKAARAAKAAKAAKARPTGADRTIAAKLRTRIKNDQLGAKVTGHVADVDSGRAVWSAGGHQAMMPASTTKIGTAVAALKALGPDHQLTTDVRLEDQTITLVGGGDELLTSGDLSALAAKTARQVKKRTPYHLRVDDSLFEQPSMSPGWSGGYYPGNVTPVRSLVVDQHQVMDTAIDAGHVFATELRERGVKVADVRRGKASEEATSVAAHHTPVSDVVIQMLLYSDNDLAEGLQRLTAVELGLPATWRGGAQAQMKMFRDLGVDTRGMKLYDGSGLSRADRISAANLVSILQAAYTKGRHTTMWPLKQGLPLAGASGTLDDSYGRFVTQQSYRAAGKVRGKTGSLHDVITLAGVTRGADGRMKAYAFMQNGAPSSLSIRQGFDGLAATVHGSW
ncbi:D-alanyl-D-alanine carboxypeptidase/D-alanyl-D-alanine-endopeptidase [Nocardioides sp. dk4132]|uniref:D-alanyl-D-alanine carboxypeptidase/D-alanyl-D-alanine endopeptidase n=1 Tax=unclassified Nocardioides TaxID=2615069 RepID=UPI00129629B2|nr:MULTISPECIES: D-alanyl-D-alanine carboxypeptidase/D-alanyl-D-alanine-endopeptidase [unclassified Nocardioides]MQW74875.1 D-alanyl-D-alanine carboxypeptidase/D-alanyl-D-alanine-endopeptidase [Nocardioides sp. dk4132]QGA06759.1 D-alanyl-D-alanine carboxypeptidase/D-alanyl-D-alanine-endopeptidase [Nocardioides sp. dk884]